MADTVKLHDKQFKIMIPESEIDAAVQRVADKLNERYAGKTPIFLGVLSGAFLFLSDLVRKTTFPSQLAFIKISSYEGTQSSVARERGAPGEGAPWTGHVGAPVGVGFG